LLSGGLDSSVLAHFLIRQGKKLRALYFDIGTLPSSMELQAAKRISFELNIPLEVVELKGIIPMIRGYTPNELDWRRSPSGIDISGFPILMSVAVYYAPLTNINHISMAVIKAQAAFQLELHCFQLEFHTSMLQIEGVIIRHVTEKEKSYLYSMNLYLFQWRRQQQY
jgi:7-cyano-7-deazaguanine synthase in queuosine biosynthesis